VNADTSTGASTGGCACGAVRYRVRLASNEGYWCHCRMCQRASGNVAIAFVNAAKADVEWTSGAPTEWQSSAIARRGRCASCGTPLTFHYPDSNHIDLTVASLDAPAAVRLTSHFGVESRVAGWIPIDDLPTTRAEDDQWLQERWAKAAASRRGDPG
jgi:hypothetical protein